MLLWVSKAEMRMMVTGGMALRMTLDTCMSFKRRFKRNFKGRFKKSKEGLRHHQDKANGICFSMYVKQRCTTKHTRNTRTTQVHIHTNNVLPLAHTPPPFQSVFMCWLVNPFG